MFQLLLLLSSSYILTILINVTAPDEDPASGSFLSYIEPTANVLPLPLNDSDIFLKKI